MGFPIDTLLLQAAGLNASDLHISGRGEAVVRISGKLIRLREILSECFLEKIPGTEANGVLTADPIRFTAAETQNLFLPREDKVLGLFKPMLSEKQQLQLKENGECDFAYALSSGHRFRINLYHSMDGFSAAVRVIPETVPSCDRLDLPAAIKNFAELKSGLVLITGATGSGKSTTLAAMLNEINQNRAAHILTLEDPVEYKFESAKSLIHQREIGNDTKNFAAGLRAALREDPDVIMVGELRDLETISTAVTAAETGHLVFATLHTRSAAETVNRMVDVFPEQQQKQIRIQLAGSLRAVISQQLLPDKMGRRTAAFEIMVVTPALRNLIREGKTQQMESYIQTGAQYGMQTMAYAIGELKRKGKI